MPRRQAKPPAAPAARKPFNSLWIYFLLVVGIFVVYGQTSGHEFLNYDDPVYNSEPHVRAGLSLSGIAWAFKSGYGENAFPLTWISHMIDWQLFGGASGAHHIVNVLLHAISSLVLFAFLKRVTGSIGRSAFVAFVFALHPLHVESVAWVTERKDVLYGLFWMLTLLAYARYAERTSIAKYALTVALFCCGLLSKPMMISFPLVALLLDWWPLRRFGAEAERRLVLEKVPLVALSIGASVVTYVAHQHLGDLSRTDQVPLLARIGNAFLSYVIYLKDFVWPSNLAVFYPYVEHPAWMMLAAAAAVLGISVLAVLEIRRRPYIAVGWFWFVVTLLPVIGLVQTGAQARADRYTYIPLIGISIIAAWGAAEVFEKRQRVLIPAAAGLCALWAFVAWDNVRYWENSIALFTHAIEVTGGNYVAYNNLGAALRQEGKIQDAVQDFERAVAILPEDALAQDNLGEALTEAGKIDEATRHLLTAVQLRPGFAKAHIDLGSALMRSGRAGEAESQYQIAVQIQPDDAAAQYGLGGVLMSEGREQEAREHLQKALPALIAEVEMNPEKVDSHYNLGTLYGILDRPEDAIVEFSQAIRMRPTDAQAHFNLGTALASRNRLKEAAEQFEMAVQLVPEYTSAHFSLGRVLAASGRYEDAAKEYRETLRLNPEFGEARRGLEAIAGQAAR